LRSNLLKWVVAVLLLLQGPAWAEDFAGRIVGVIDGDTVDLLTDAKVLMRIRLSGIDAPEKKQPFGNAAKRMLSALTFDRRVVVSAKKKDRYGRYVGKVFVGGTDANLQMVQHGLAWHYKKYERQQSSEDRVLYAEAELKAKAKRIGVWADKDSVAPWDFRQPNRGRSRAAAGSASAVLNALRVKVLQARAAAAASPHGYTLCASLNSAV